MMAQTMTQRHFDEAQKHVELGIRHVIRQREIVRQLERDGLAKAAEQARQLLDTFEAALELQNQHLDTVAGEVAADEALRNAARRRPPEA